MSRIHKNRKKTRVVLVGIYDTNSVSLAPYILKSYVKQFEVTKNFEIVTKEFSIFRDKIGLMIQGIKREKPDIVGFSVYIWNINEILEIIKSLDTIIILGGPQITGIEKELLRENTNIDIIVSGEGELTFLELLEYFNGDRKIEDVKGIFTKEGLKTELRRELIELDSIPSVYGDIFVSHREDIKWISFETSRGCPMTCRFCTWAYSKKIRYYSIERVKSDLDVILKQKNIKEIYFCDSSLLFNKKRAKVILKHIIEADTDKTFRYEFFAEQLDDELIDLLVKLPGHEFNFGIQSINERALYDMNRVFSRNLFERNYRLIAKKSKGVNNITVDLIYGLPGDNIEGYKSSLNYAISLPEVRRILTNPLVVLPGSAFYRNRDKYILELRDGKSYIVKSNYTFSEFDMELARKYSFFVAVIYFNYCLRDYMKIIAEKLGKTYIDTIIAFMESLPFDIIEGEAYPDMVPSVKKDFDRRNSAFIRVIERYGDIINHFKSSFHNVCDIDFSNHHERFSEHFYKLKHLLSGV